ncbi:hypothetical protein SBF1_4710002 [Candidatus Desulfosporosinus infrequens]|uniref:Uncharacterized protein n=1 Tax=Candidatus Desulfosporosinus infrequens TaxID=2043169 RepID=A0A2U3LEW4_9FIRM|nr:hypothetical protein SBF1_4710002 [Candidatus Desulfosporosinus infrequens]
MLLSITKNSNGASLKPFNPYIKIIGFRENNKGKITAHQRGRQR